MLKTQTSLSTQSPVRLLKPARLLARLRPVSLKTINFNLAQWDYLCKAVRLAQQHAPAELETLPKAYDWDNLLNRVLRAVEKAEGFEIDWDMLDADYQYWMEDEDGGRLDNFAQWLDFIPLARYGFSSWDDNWPNEYPVMALIKALVVQDWGEELLVQLIDDNDLQADWAGLTHYELIERLNTADFSAYAVPLCWLPEVARIAAGETGNPLLDYSNYMEEEPPLYEWGELDQVRELWRETKPMVEKLRAFLAWATGPAEMQAVVNALVGREERKRKRKPKRGRLAGLVELLTPGVERVRVRA